MKIALIGITGKIGQHIAQEAHRRGHQITGIARRDVQLEGELASTPIVVADITDASALAQAIRGHDVLVSAFGPAPDAIGSLQTVTTALVAAARTAGIKRVLVVGGAGSLEVAPGLQLVDTPTFPDMYKPYALAHRDALGLLRHADDLAWTFYAPAAEIGPGERKGAVRVGARTLIADSEGHSRISYPDYADAFVDEIENGAYIREIATAAY